VLNEESDGDLPGEAHEVATAEFHGEEDGELDGEGNDKYIIIKSWSEDWNKTEPGY